MLEPVADRLGGGMGPLSGVVGAAGGALLAVEVGAISGLLGQRVLGQYEFPILEPEAPARLLFVSPNLAQAAISLEAEPDELLRWVALHEITHALQFGGVPWLRPHLAETVARAARRARGRPRSACSACPTSAISRGSWRRCARATWRR